LWYNHIIGPTWPEAAHNGKRRPAVLYRSALSCNVIASILFCSQFPAESGFIAVLLNWLLHMIYKVQLAEGAKQDLHSIYEYIAFSLLEPGIAKKIRQRIVDGLNSLGQMPDRYSVYQEEPWKSRGLRRINIGNYSGFYLVGKNTVQVIRIVYSGRDIGSILKESD